MLNGIVLLRDVKLGMLNVSQLMILTTAVLSYVLLTRIKNNYV